MFEEASFASLRNGKCLYLTVDKLERAAEAVLEVKKKIVQTMNLFKTVQTTMPRRCER